MILMAHQHDKPKEEARVTTSITPPEGMTLLPIDFNPGNRDVSLL